MKGEKSMKTDFNLLRSVGSRGGFTLLEVLIVVVIAVLVTMFAVPSYRKAQERNRFMAATGVLMDIGNAARMLHEAEPDLNISWSVTANGTGTSCPEEPTAGNIMAYLQCHNYLSELPLADGNYQGYIFSASTVSAACGNSCYIPSGAWACMNGSNAIKEYQCAWIDRGGVLHHSEWVER